MDGVVGVAEDKHSGISCQRDNAELFAEGVSMFYKSIMLDKRPKRDYESSMELFQAARKEKRATETWMRQLISEKNPANEGLNMTNAWLYEARVLYL